MIDLDDAAYQNAEAGKDADADFADESEAWTNEQWDAYEAEMRAEYDAAMGPVVDAATAAEWERERMVAVMDPGPLMSVGDDVPF